MEEQKTKKRKSALVYTVGVILLFILIGIIRTNNDMIFGINEKELTQKIRFEFNKISGTTGTFSSFTSVGNPVAGFIKTIFNSFNSKITEGGFLEQNPFEVPSNFIPTVEGYDNINNSGQNIDS